MQQWWKPLGQQAWINTWCSTAEWIHRQHQWNSHWGTGSAFWGLGTEIPESQHSTMCRLILPSYKAWCRLTALSSGRFRSHPAGQPFSPARLTAGILWPEQHIPQSHSQHVKEPFPLFTSHFLPICFSSKLPVLIVCVGYMREGAIPPLCTSPLHCLYFSITSESWIVSPCSFQEGGRVANIAFLLKISFSRESMDRTNSTHKQG